MKNSNLEESDCSCIFILIFFSSINPSLDVSYFNDSILMMNNTINKLSLRLRFDVYWTQFRSCILNVVEKREKTVTTHLIYRTKTAQTYSCVSCIILRIHIVIKPHLVYLLVYFFFFLSLHSITIILYFKCLHM